MPHSRHPYTYAADFIRTLAGVDEHGCRVSRADASIIRQGIAKAIGMDDRELACKLSEAYQAGQLSEETEQQAFKFLEMAKARAGVV